MKIYGEILIRKAFKHFDMNKPIKILDSSFIIIEMNTFYNLAGVLDYAELKLYQID